MFLADIFIRTISAFKPKGFRPFNPSCAQRILALPPILCSEDFGQKYFGALAEPAYTLSLPHEGKFTRAQQLIETLTYLLNKPSNKHSLSQLTSPWF